MKGDEGMREIKFRAWDKYTEEMWNVETLHIEDEYVDLFKTNIYEKPLENPWAKISDVILMQYTGLKDKNGVEIYEGDIVKVISGHGWEDVSDVVFGLTDKRYGSYPAFCMPGVETESNSFSEVFDSGDYEIEVIGNIYEHKYLLREEGFSDE